MRRIVYIDIESTGLDVDLHQVWEIAYAVGDGEVRSCLIPHTLENADPKALVIGRYSERWNYKTAQAFSAGFLSDLVDALDGSTLAGANPRFDAAFLKKLLGREVWHYRLLDVPTYAMAAINADTPLGLLQTCESLGTNARPDHSAAADVEATRAAHLAAQDVYDGWRPASEKWLT